MIYLKNTYLSMLITEPRFTYQKKELAGERKILQNCCFHFAKIDSTNDWLIQQEKKLPNGAIASCDFQQQGKGRWGKTWQAKNASSALFSSLYRPKKKFPTHLITLAVGVAICECFEQLGINNASLKWPNDVLIAEKKIAGVLCERFSNFLVIGIGINSLQKISDFSLEIVNKASSVFIASRKKINPFKILTVCSLKVDKILQNLEIGETIKVLKKWEYYCTSYKNISYQDPKTKKMLLAKIQGLDYTTGELVVKTNTGKINNLSAGEISIEKFTSD